MKGMDSAFPKQKGATIFSKLFALQHFLPFIVIERGNERLIRERKTGGERERGARGMNRR